ncbi:MAG: hypothetical protein HGA45_37135 [Chloroflexales bacterium]|nr:hypothetical protein [Chloroflexales bacterium]
MQNRDITFLFDPPPLEAIAAVVHQFNPAITAEQVASTTALIRDLVGDLPLTLAHKRAYDVYSGQHYLALRRAMIEEAVATRSWPQLVAALAPLAYDGPAICAFVQDRLGVLTVRFAPPPPLPQ